MEIYWEKIKQILPAAGVTCLSLWLIWSGASEIGKLHGWFTAKIVDDKINEFYSWGGMITGIIFIKLLLRKYYDYVESTFSWLWVKFFDTLEYIFEKLTCSILFVLFTPFLYTSFVINTISEIIHYDKQLKRFDLEKMHVSMQKYKVIFP